MRVSSRLRATYPSAMECSTERPDPKLLPLEVVREAWASCIREVTSADLQYASTEPIKALADILVPAFEGDLIPARAQDLIIGSSAQQFFALIYEVVSAKSENPGCWLPLRSLGTPPFWTLWSVPVLDCWALQSTSLAQRPHARCGRA